MVVEDAAVAVERKDVWASGDAYEPYVGRWSRLVAQPVPSVACTAHRDWLDIGCGTGALSQVILESASPRHVTGVDPLGWLCLFCTPVK